MLIPSADAADFGTPGGPAPANIDEIAKVLRQDPYDIELLISFGTSKGGSAGHLALAIRDGAAGDDMVYSANFYADRARRAREGLLYRRPHGRDPEEASTCSGRPRRSATRPRSASTSARSTSDRSSACASTACRRGEAGAWRPTSSASTTTIADARRETEYHDGEVKYDYLRLNCAKTIGAGFKFGAGYQDLEVTSAKILPGAGWWRRRNANIPTEMAMKLIEEWNARGYGLDVVLYKKYAGST